MNIKTKFHGELTIQQDQTWIFPKSIPGFEDEDEFVLLPIEENDVFQVLQSTKTPDVAFIIVNPYTIVEDYSFKVDEPTINLLDIKSEEDIFILGVLSVKEPFETSTLNLQAPIIFNATTRKAKQMILNDNTFSMRHPIGTQLTTEGEA